MSVDSGGRVTVLEGAAAPAVEGGEVPGATAASCSAHVSDEVKEVLARAVSSGRCTPSWAEALGSIAEEGTVLQEQDDVRVAHLLHRSLRAEATRDALAGERISSTRAPDLAVQPDPGAPRFALPTELPDEAHEFAEVVAARRSMPMFDASPLSLERLSAVLRLCLAGKGTAFAYQRRDIQRRVFPSAGGLQSVDAQLLVADVAGLPRGRYAYDPVEHSLALLEEGDFRVPVKESAIATDWLLHAPCVLALVSNLDRLTWKYGSRGYRYAAMDVGVVAGQLYLAGASMGLAVNAVAAFADDAMNALLRVDGRAAFVQLLVTLGNPPRRRDDT